MTPTKITRRTALLALGASFVLPSNLRVFAEDDSLRPHLIPPGAAACGFMKKLFDVKPTVADISPDRKGVFPWYNGQWCTSKLQPMDKYFMTDGVLTLAEDGDLVSYPPDFSHPGTLPTLSGEKGFYIEFEVSLSDNDQDHWPSLWLMPIEKNNKQTDAVYDGAPEKFEHWMELDIEEGGFSKGTTTTVHNCWGIWPNYHHIQNGNNWSNEPLDRTQKHRFGASYDPRTSTVCWWLDEKMIRTATAPYVPEVAKRQHFYILITAQMHKEKKPYKMYVHAVRAYEPMD